MYELTRLIRDVSLNWSGWALIHLMIWGPVNRSWALEPVISANCSAPPTADSISRHSEVVDESCQLGMTARENASFICSRSGLEGLMLPRVDEAF